MKDFLLDQSLAVRTFALSQVKHCVLKTDVSCDSVVKYKTDIVKWLSPIIDLTSFYVYPMNGITEGLNWWYAQEGRTVCTNSGEYQWIKSKKGSKNIIKYQSVPSSSDGNFCEIESNYSVALDLAYIGSTNIKKIQINKNVEYVFYSLSKSFGLSNLRTGWFFTRKPDQRLEDLIYSAKYYNYFAQNVAENVISNFDIDYVYRKLHNQQLKTCKELDLIPSDSVWIATTTAEKYAKFRRRLDIARICLSGLYEKC